MCGIAGYWSPRHRVAEHEARQVITSMIASIAYRGPDEDGIHIDEQAGLGLGHKRLSIVDLTPAGAQPMQTRSGRFVIVYNGELYNTEELRADLQGPFRGHSDTEVLIESIETFGIEATLKKLNGMFAFAVYDRQEKQLTLARDQIGIKPLFWAYRNDALTFGSELKPLTRFPGWNGEISLPAARDFFDFNYIPGPRTIYKNAEKLLPGHYLTLREGGVPVIIKYWSTEDNASGPDISENDAVDYFETLLSDSIRRQMVSDVPLGVFLSGGIDSSLVAALMQKQSAKPVRTFTIGFKEDTYNETNYARQVAQHIGSDHTEEILSVRDALNLIPRLPEHYDEPFADSSQLPSMLLCQTARKHVTVCLSGDGGDELFLGYNRYFYGSRLFKKLNALGKFPGARHLLLMASRLPWKEGGYVPQNMGLKFLKMASMLLHPDTPARYTELTSLWPEADSPVKYTPEEIKYPPITALSDIAYMQKCDLNRYLPDDILQKMDRASMASSLEARVPLLDTRLVGAALSIPSGWHYRDGKGKSILRTVLARHAPNALFERPKQGFSVPVSAWLRLDLRDMAETYLSERALDEVGYLDTRMIRERWAQHQAGTHNWEHSIWGTLMFQMWREKYNA